MNTTHLPEHLAHRMEGIQPFHVMDLLAKAKALEAQGRSIIHMEVGEPDFLTTEPVKIAAQEVVSKGDVHYTPALGLPALRDRIARYYAERYGVEVSPQRIIVTPGASGALLLALGVLLNPGERVLMSDPGYPCNRNFVRFLNGEPVSIPVYAETNYQLNASHILDHWAENTAAVMVASPANPTGTLIPTDMLKEIITTVEEQGGHLLVDEIYHGLEYEGRSDTALGFSDNVFVINSFSKFFGMTGWRLGWLVVPESYVPEVDKLAQNLFLAAPTVSQHAAIAAFSEENMTILEERRQEFQRRRDFLLPALRDIGFTIPVNPSGAFYIYAGCERFTQDSYQFVTQLLEDTGVAITPGLDFGDNAPERHVRFSYATSIENLHEAVKRLQKFLGA
jgi:aspartate/methionine/tyrosine aminotransferase